jgi:hypothetical protein
VIEGAAMPLAIIETPSSFHIVMDSIPKNGVIVIILHDLELPNKKWDTSQKPKIDL